MPKYPIDNEPFISQDKTQETVIKPKQYSVCCINKNVCMVLSTILCICLTIGSLTFLNIYYLHEEDGSLFN